jgi:hypothetical protein
VFWLSGGALTDASADWQSRYVKSWHTLSAGWLSGIFLAASVGAICTEDNRVGNLALTPSFA